MAAKFKTADFDGPWLRSFGRPVLKGIWMVWGVSGVGKTNFLLQLAKYLSQFVPNKVIYDSLEEGLSLTIQEAWDRQHLKEAGTKVGLYNAVELEELDHKLSKKKSPDVVIIDSLQKLKYKLRYNDIDNMRKRHPNKLFIIISQVGERGEPKGEVAKAVRHDADIKMVLDGYRAHIITRYADSQGNGGEDFVYWQEGADIYDGNIILNEN
ncbi:MAG: DNA repair protein RadA [Bacteroidales bacterium]|nr:DNA repair protein RadA [Bacteroidales bacterium]